MVLRPRLDWTVNEVTDRAAGVWTGRDAEVTGAAESAAPLFASVPTASTLKASVPEAVPFSVNLQTKLALAPPGTSVGAGVAVTDAPAPPPATTWRSRG